MCCLQLRFALPHEGSHQLFCDDCVLDDPERRNRFRHQSVFFKLVLEPICQVKRTLSDISSTALFHQALIRNARPDEHVSEEFRKLAASLSGDVSAVCWYDIWYYLRIFGIPLAGNVPEACRQLIWISHGIRPVSRETEHKEVCERDWAIEITRSLEKLDRLLNIKTTYADPPKETIGSTN